MVRVCRSVCSRRQARPSRLSFLQCFAGALHVLSRPESGTCPTYSNQPRGANLALGYRPLQVRSVQSEHLSRLSRGELPHHSVHHVPQQLGHVKKNRSGYFRRPGLRFRARSPSKSVARPRSSPLALSVTLPLARGICTGRRGLGKCQESGQFGGELLRKRWESQKRGPGATPRPCPRRCYLLPVLTQIKNQKSVFRRVLDLGGGAPICSDHAARRGSSAVESTIFCWQPLARFWSLEGCFAPPECHFLSSGRLTPLRVDLPAGGAVGWAARGVRFP